jgi:hypothetical protein
VPVGGGDDEAVARAEYDELAVLDGPAFGSGGAVAGEHVGESAERRVPRNEVCAPGSASDSPSTRSRSTSPATHGSRGLTSSTT